MMKDDLREKERLVIFFSHAVIQARDQRRYFASFQFNPTPISTRNGTRIR